ncbi:MAG: 2-isopropylmalate synthase [Eubacteriaceae bacterium]|nr:2-isopropylmalate synthase [Eubacteriaceae bacterium]
MQNYDKYRVGYYMPPENQMKWVKKDHLDKAPHWCSVDLRDGNQALIVPMSLEEKLEFFQYLVDLGFKEIEVGFPAASDTEYELLRTLIEKDMIPDDVKVQVLTQSREHIISKTFEALKGVKNAIVHLYNSTSVAQREQVFKKSKKEIMKIATDGARLIKRYAAENPGSNYQFEYSPESFSGTEPDYATEVCNAVIDIWGPTPENKVIINLPSTVQMSMPHVYASQIEYVSDHLHDRKNVLISLHPHNDRGTGVADAELGLLAGGDRIEGTLFGNGERTGNVDIVTLAMNMYTHGVDPGLDFSDMPTVVRNYEKFTDMKVPPRQPYGGKLVFAAFSGSHQDAIAKGMKYREDSGSDRWTVPYLPIDPHDLGREYEADVIRINSQSGKGGVAYILEHNFGYTIPTKMREEIGYMVKGVSDKQHKELSPDEIFELFDNEYINVFDPIDITDATFKRMSDYKDGTDINVEIDVDISGETYHLSGEGNGRLDAVSNALRKAPYTFSYDFVTYSEHALESESDSRAAAYVAISDSNGWVYWGVGLHDDIIYASVNALVSAINRMNQISHFVE